MRLSKLSILEERPAKLTPKIVTFLFLFLFRDLLFFYIFVVLLGDCFCFFLFTSSVDEEMLIVSSDLVEGLLGNWLKKDELGGSSLSCSSCNEHKPHNGQNYRMAKHCIFL